MASAAGDAVNAVNDTAGAAVDGIIEAICGIIADSSGASRFR